MSEWIWLFIELLNAGLETIIMLLFVDAFFVRRRKIITAKFTIIFAAVWILKFVTTYFLHESIAVIASTTAIGVLLLGLFYNRRNLWLNALSMICYLLLAVCMEYLATTLVTALQSRVFRDVIDFNSSRIQTIVIMDLLKLLFIKLLQRIRSGSVYETHGKFWAAIYLLPLISIIISHQLLRDSLLAESPRTAWAIISMMGLVFVNIVIFALFETLVRREENARLLEVAMAQIQIEKEHIESLVKNREEIKIMVHDFKHHLLMLTHMCEAGEFSELSDSITKLSNEQFKARAFIKTGNPSLDVALSIKREKAEMHGILCRWDIAVTPALPLPILDVCNILANALDNAIEACCRATENKFIEMEMRSNENCLLCKITNTLGIAPQEKDGYLQTLKQGGKLHGLGLKSIEHCCNNLRGGMNCEYNSDVFELRFIVPFSENLDK